MTTFKSYADRNCLFQASREPNSINILITPFNGDGYKPIFIFKLPISLYSYIDSLSHDEFIKFCISYFNISYKDFYLHFNL